MPRTFAGSNRDQVGSILQHQMDVREPYINVPTYWQSDAERRHTVSQVDYLGREVDEEQTEGANFYFGEGTRHRHQHDARLSHALERDVWRRRSIELEKEAKLTAELKHWNNIFQVTKSADRERVKSEKAEEARLFEEMPFGRSSNFSHGQRAVSEANRESAQRRRAEQAHYAAELQQSIQEKEWRRQQQPETEPVPSSLHPFMDEHVLKPGKLLRQQSDSAVMEAERSAAYSKHLEQQIREKKHAELTERQAVLSTRLDSILASFGKDGGGAPLRGSDGLPRATIARVNILDPAERHRMAQGRDPQHQQQAREYAHALDAQIEHHLQAELVNNQAAEAGQLFTPVMERDDSREIRRVNIQKRLAAAPASADETLFRTMGRKHEVVQKPLTEERAKELEKQRDTANELARIVDDSRRASNAQREQDKQLEQQSLSYNPFGKGRPPRRSRDPSVETHVDGRPLATDPSIIQSRQAYRAELEAQLRHIELDKMMTAIPERPYSGLKLSGASNTPQPVPPRRAQPPHQLAPIRLERPRVDPAEAATIHSVLTQQVQEHRALADQAKAASLELAQKHINTNAAFEGDYQKRRKQQLQAAGPADFGGAKPKNRQKSPKTNVGHLLNQPTKTEAISNNAKKSFAHVRPKIT